MQVTAAKHEAAETSAGFRQLFGLGLKDLKEQVVVALAHVGGRDARLLKEVSFYRRAREPRRCVKPHADELAEARRVIVAHSLCVAKGLEYIVGGDQLVADCSGGVGSGVCRGHLREEEEDLLRVLGLASA